MKNTLKVLFLTAVMSSAASHAQLSIDHFGQMNVNAGLTQVMNAATLAAAKQAPKPSGSTSLDGGNYRPQEATADKAKQALIAMFRNNNAAAADELVNVLASRDIIGMFGRDMARYDLAAGNVADAVTAFLVANWMIANRADDPEPEQVKAVRNNIAHAMADSIAKLDNEQRQFMSEVLIYQTMFAVDARNGARANPAALARLADNSHQTLVAMGVNLREMQLTDAGLELR